MVNEREGIAERMCSPSNEESPTQPEDINSSCICSTLRIGGDLGESDGASAEEVAEAGAEVAFEDAKTSAGARKHIASKHPEGCSRDRQSQNVPSEHRVHAEVDLSLPTSFLQRPANNSIQFLEKHAMKPPSRCINSSKSTEGGQGSDSSSGARMSLKTKKSSMETVAQTTKQGHTCAWF
mmetsp:Transcript_88370/g.184698  ORF Transcript_88370/g.184698 Transcript_88370/m.184698 type:complete len:180 (+) Transcript_88370:108-647(+)|eukprot:CAMPEP_0206505452 /NCGR_PEP_ID=MMETSP0324_2-20121206/56142_1 /ASSEMBLY_ACC=CAM_ASM_000836 /TAXON_ID=2866 /ORGANISM="Crypthecodinium cohnii, Strain Seligo" /LENGTH=179 /DNA_ID=CAMNT_0053994921 /DNA_START=99 /DNA_END=638 /DNA_ORIENTATION=+